MNEEDVNRAVQSIVQRPGFLREYTANPNAVINKSMGKLRGIGTSPGDKQRLHDALSNAIQEDPYLKTSADTLRESETFLHDQLGNPQRAFNATLWMSVAAFGLGVGLIVGAFAAGFLANGTVQKAVLSSLSGTAGLVTTLGTVFNLTRGAIRRASGENIQLRVILNSYATQIARLRRVQATNPDDVKSVNAQVEAVTADTIKLLRTVYASVPENSSASRGRPSGTSENQPPSDRSSGAASASDSPGAAASNTETTT